MTREDLIVNLKELCQRGLSKKSQVDVDPIRAVLRALIWRCSQECVHQPETVHDVIEAFRDLNARDTGRTPIGVLQNIREEMAELIDRLYALLKFAAHCRRFREGSQQPEVHTFS